MEGQVLRRVPIQRLPVELLEIIFLTSLPHGSSPEHYKQVDMLSSVSRRWNTMVKTTPFIWTTLSMSFPPNRNLVALERSSGYPLEIHGMYPDEDEEGLKECPQKTALLLEQALPHMARWSKAYFELSSVDAYYQLCKETAAAPLLEEANFMVHDLEEVPESELDFFLGNAPRLKAFTTNLPVPWSSHLLRNLARLKLVDQSTEDMTIEILVRILGDCPGLIELDLSGEGAFSHDADVEQPVSPPIPLPHLRRLCLALQICCAYNILQSIELPSNLSTYQVQTLDAAGVSWFSDGEAMIRWWKKVGAFLFSSRVTRLLCCEVEQPRAMLCQGFKAPKPETDDEDDANLIASIMLVAEEHGELPIGSFYDAYESLELPAPKLSIWGTGGRTEEAVNRLSVLPKLDKLMIGPGQPLGLFLQSMSAPLIGATDSREWGFPGLESLSFINGVEVDQGKLLETVDTRWGQASVDGIKMNKPKPLRALEIDGPEEELQPDIRRKLEDILGDCVLHWPAD